MRELLQSLHLSRYFAFLALEETKAEVASLKERLKNFLDGIDDDDDEPDDVFELEELKEILAVRKTMLRDINKAIKAIDKTDIGGSIYTTHVVEAINRKCSEVLKSKPVTDRNAMVERLLAIAHHNQLWCYDAPNEDLKDPSEVHVYRVWFNTYTINVSGATPSGENITDAYVTFEELNKHALTTPWNVRCPRSSNPDLCELEIG